MLDHGSSPKAPNSEGMTSVHHVPYSLNIVLTVNMVSPYRFSGSPSLPRELTMVSSLTGPNADTLLHSAVHNNVTKSAVQNL